MAVDPSRTFADSPRPENGGSSGGAAGAIQFRLAEDTYTSGGSTLAGADRPNTRTISNIVFSQTDDNGAPVSIPSEGGFSNMVWVWGQFLDHDIVQSPNGPAFGSAPITVPNNDPFFDPGTVLNFNRSEFVTGTGTSDANPRQYANNLTSLIDGSNIYGSSAEKLEALLQPDGAKLRITADGTIGFASGDPVFGNGVITGDTRANENVGLLSMHALFVREHNRMVDELAAADPSLNANELFEGARARVEAIMQAITYNEYLPILIGENALDEYDGFDSRVNPAISLEFSTAVYRFGHSLLSASIGRINENGTTHTLGNLALRDAFNSRGVVEQTGIDALLRGLSSSMTQEFDTFFVEDVRSMLFGRGGPGSDLAALNIQRGRDHGLPTYNGLRVALGLDAKTSFAQVTSDPEMAQRLSQAYGGDISKLDLYVGGLAEDPVGGGMMGETYRAVMIDQFTRLRDGDRFWSEGRGFSAAELEELWDTKLSDVIVRNTDVDVMQEDAFVAYVRQGGGAGADTIFGRGASRNLLMGNAGNDRIIGGGLDDEIFGGDGADRLEGRGGPDKLFGGRGNDLLIGNAGRDTVHGDGGDDIVVIRAGESVTDTMDGGAGTDTLRIEPSGGNVVLAGTGLITNFEILDGNGRSIIGATGDDVFDFSGFATVSDLASVRGGRGDDTIIGSRFNDVILGGLGNDTLRGDDGDDELLGQEGVDLIFGNGGDDVIVIRADEAVLDRVDGGAGADVLRVDASGGDVFLTDTRRISSVEILQAGGVSVRGTEAGNVLDFSTFSTVTGLASVRGHGGNDTITGSSGDDIIFGGRGSDRIVASAGDDVLVGNRGNDVFVYAAGRADGRDRILDFDADSNDRLQFQGYDYGVRNPGSLSDQDRMDAIADATDFQNGRAVIHLDELGGAGSIVLEGVTRLSFTGTEDFLFG